MRGVFRVLCVICRGAGKSGGIPGRFGDRWASGLLLFQVLDAVKGLIEIRRDALYPAGKLPGEINPRDRDDNRYDDSDASKH